MADVSDKDRTFDKDDISDLQNIPNAFNIGECILKIDEQGFIVDKDSNMYSDVWNFLEKEITTKNVLPVDAMIPEFWKLNLMTRAYVELNKFEKAEILNKEAIRMSGSCNIAALANEVVLLRHLGKRREALDKANELKEKQEKCPMALEFEKQMIDAFSEQAYYHLKLYKQTKNKATDILELVDHLRHLRGNGLKDHEKYLLFRSYRHLAFAKEKEIDKADHLKTVKLLHDIEKGKNNMLKALTYIEMERIMGHYESVVMTEEFKTNEKRSKDDFIKLALNLGGKSALILLQIGIQKMKSGETELAKKYFNDSFVIEPYEKTLYYLGHLYHQDAQRLTKEENELVQIQKELTPHCTDLLRQYLLRYKNFIDWTHNHDVKEALLKAVYYFEQHNKYLKHETMRSAFHLALLYMRCKKYNEAIGVINSHIQSSECLYKSALIEAQMYILKAVAVEAEHTGPGISAVSKESLKVAIQKSCLKTEEEVATMSDDILLTNIQKIPSFKIFRAEKNSVRNVDENIRQFLKDFGPKTESDKIKQFNPEFLEISCIRSASFLIENGKYREAMEECKKIISGVLLSNIFTNVQAFILEAKALEMPFLSTKRPIKKKSLKSIEKALNLMYPGDKWQNASKSELYKGLKSISPQFSYFLMTA